MKRNESGRPSSVNKTKFMEVEVAWLVSGMRCKNGHFFTFQATTRTCNFWLLGNTVGVPSVWRSVCEPHAFQSGLGWASVLRNHLEQRVPLQSAFQACLPYCFSLVFRNEHHHCCCCVNRKLFLMCIMEEKESPLSVTWPERPKRRNFGPQDTANKVGARNSTIFNINTKMKIVIRILSTPIVRIAFSLTWRNVHPSSTTTCKVKRIATSNVMGKQQVISKVFQIYSRTLWESMQSHKNRGIPCQLSVNL